MTALSAIPPISIVNPPASALASQLPSDVQSAPLLRPGMPGPVGETSLTMPAHTGIAEALAGLQQQLTQLSTAIRSMVTGTQHLQPPLTGGGSPVQTPTSESSCPMKHSDSTNPEQQSQSSSKQQDKPSAPKPMPKADSDRARFFALSPVDQKRAVEYFKKLDAAKANPKTGPKTGAGHGPASPPTKSGKSDAPAAPEKSAAPPEKPTTSVAKGWEWNATSGGGVSVTYDGTSVGHFYTNDRKGNHEYNGGHRDDSSDNARISQLVDVKTSGGGHSIKTPDGRTIIHYDKHGNTPGSASATPEPAKAKPAKPAATAGAEWTTRTTSGGGVSAYFDGKQVGHFYTNDSTGNHIYNGGRRDDSSNNALISQLTDVATSGGGHSIKTPDGQTVIHYDKNGNKA